jgi:hypothetical protein
MNIKKIIQEEINDFNWVEDIPGEVRVTDSSQLEVGSRIRVEISNLWEYPHLGTVVNFDDGGFYLVTFDERFSSSLHGGYKNEDPTKSSYYFNLSDIDDGDDVIYLV